MDKVMINKGQNSNGFDVESLPIADLVNSIKKALVYKQAEMQEHGIGIKNIQLTLKTMATSNTGAGISLQIPILGKVEFGSEISEKSLQTTSLTLKPPIQGKMVQGVKLIDMEETLAQSISSIIEGVKAANGQGPISLEMEEATAEFNFILSGNSEISMIIGTGFESQLSNTLKIKFKKREIKMII
ncbi:MAG: trypco2 family protein [Methanobacterium sp.]